MSMEVFPILTETDKMIVCMTFTWWLGIHINYNYVYRKPEYDGCFNTCHNIRLHSHNSGMYYHYKIILIICNSKNDVEADQLEHYFYGQQ